MLPTERFLISKRRVVQLLRHIITIHECQKFLSSIVEFIDSLKTIHLSSSFSLLAHCLNIFDKIPHNYLNFCQSYCLQSSKRVIDFRLMIWVVTECFPLIAALARDILSSTRVLQELVFPLCAPLTNAILCLLWVVQLKNSLYEK